MPSVRIKRGTREQIEDAAVAAELAEGELYLIADEGRLAVGLGTTLYEEFAKLSDVLGSAAESSPAFTYTSGVVTRIDYASGNYKLFTYTSGLLTQLDYVVGTTTTRKTFTYNPDGTLSSVSQTVLP